MREPERHAGSLDVLTMLAIRCDDKKKVTAWDTHGRGCDL